MPRKKERDAAHRRGRQVVDSAHPYRYDAHEGSERSSFLFNRQISVGGSPETPEHVEAWILVCKNKQCSVYNALAHARGLN